MPLAGYPAHQLVSREIISTQVTLSRSSRLYLYIIIAKKKRPLIWERRRAMGGGGGLRAVRGKNGKGKWCNYTSISNKNPTKYFLHHPGLNWENGEQYHQYQNPSRCKNIEERRKLKATLIKLLGSSSFIPSALSSTSLKGMLACKPQRRHHLNSVCLRKC